MTDPRYSLNKRSASETFAAMGAGKEKPVGGALCGFQGAKLEKEI
jgi:hypothetical protein